MKKHVDVRKIVRQIGLRYNTNKEGVTGMLEWKDARSGPRPETVVLFTDGSDFYLGFYNTDLEEWVSCYLEDEYDEITHYAEINLPE